MFLINKPDEASIRQFLATQTGEKFSYSEIGLTRNEAVPDGYTIDHNRIKLGAGRKTFDRAIEAVRNWRMFELSWIKLCFDNTPIEEAKVVAVLIKHFGFWSFNVSRIVYVFEERNAEVERFGFAYGTLSEHAERGEERFSVEYHKTDESVWYDLYAFSQPNHILAKLGYPLSRHLQKTIRA